MTFAYLPKVCQCFFAKGSPFSFTTEHILTNSLSCKSYNPENPGSDNKIRTFATSYPENPIILSILVQTKLTTEN